MDRICPRTLRGSDDGRDIQIALTRGRGADMDCLIGHLHMLRGFIGVGEYRDAVQPHAACGTDNAAGDFATIGNE